MPGSQPTTSTTRRSWSPGRVAGAVALAVSVALGAACTASTDVQAGGTGGGSGAVGGTAPSVQTVPPTSADPGQVDASEPASGPITTCVDGPATTTPFGQGGGRITCSTIPPDGAVSSPVNTDTTVAPSTTSLRVDNQHGVLVVSAAGGLACGDEACPDLAVIMQGRIVVEGDGVSESADLDSSGRVGFRLAPGTYQVRAEVTEGSCDSTSVTLGLRQQDVALRCRVPR